MLEKSEDGLPAEASAEAFVTSTSCILSGSAGASPPVRVQFWLLRHALRAGDLDLVDGPKDFPRFWSEKSLLP